MERFGSMFAALQSPDDLPLDIGAGRRGPGRMDDVAIILGVSFGLLLLILFTIFLIIFLKRCRNKF